jgi:hypothetical protein
MFRKTAIISSFLILTVILSACSALPISSLSLASLTGSSQTSSSSSVQSHLAVGLLSLEGTSQAVTVDQAATLMPLWQAVSALSKDSNTSSVELKALYAQIQETLTADQVSAIQAQAWTDSQVSALMQKYSVSAAQNTGKANNSSSGTAQTQDTASIAAMTVNADGTISTGIDMTGAVTTAQTTSTTQGAAAQPASNAMTSSQNVTFANAIVTLLKVHIAENA